MLHLCIHLYAYNLSYIMLHTYITITSALNIVSILIILTYRLYRLVAFLQDSTQKRVFDSLPLNLGRNKIK